MGISDLNFDFGFIDLFVFFGVPFVIFISLSKVIEYVTDKIETIRFRTKTPEGILEFEKYLSEKYQKKRERELKNPKLVKILRNFSITGWLLFLVLTTFVWFQFLIKIGY